MFERVLIANRGEVAVRVIRACRELGVESVAVYSTADRESLHVRLADHAVHIGPPPAAQSYLSISSLVAAATTTRCEAVHPGWGFLAENADFARTVEDNDLVFVGPTAESIEVMGDKVSAKQTMRDAGVPVVPGSDGEATLAEASELAAGIGFPLLLKASAGGGGKGMRLVDDPRDLEPAFRMAAAEAEASFGNGGLYVEKALVDARHVEIQVLGDGDGGVLTLGERDCSVQRRHQKLVEEGPSPAVTPELRAEMEAAASRACETLRYRGAGTLEFLLNADGFHFIEMNTRLQVEHPVTELLTGVDLARGQLAVAAGEGLPATGRAELRGHAIEVRVNAEDPAREFLPAPGTLTRFVAAARARGSSRHARVRGLRHPALLRLSDRQADRLGRRSSGRARPRSPRAARIRARRSADDTRAGHGHPPEPRVRERRVHDPFPRGVRGRPASPRPRRGMSGSRREARRTALFVLYQWDLTGQPLASLWEGEIDAFGRALAVDVSDRAPELDARISELSRGWPADRLGALERNILRIGIVELDRGEVPAEVAVDEAVHLAKRFASPDAAKLVNGILGTILRERAA